MFLRIAEQISNVFPESMETSVVRMQLDETLQFQSIPPLLPAYNRYIGGAGADPGNLKGGLFHRCSHTHF